jgi:hypothetical protein
VHHHEDIGRGDTQFAEVAHQYLVQAALGLAGTTGEHRHLDQDEVVAAAGWQLEVGAVCSTMRCTRSWSGISRASTRAVCAASSSACF